LKTPFWEMATSDTPLGDLQEYVDFYRAVGPSPLGFHKLPKIDVFSQEGYMVMLLGMQVPWENSKKYASLSSEKGKILKFFKQGNLLKAMQGISTEELLTIIRSDNW